MTRHDLDPAEFAATLLCGGCGGLGWHYRRPLRDDQGRPVYVSHCCDVERTWAVGQSSYGAGWAS